MGLLQEVNLQLFLERKFFIFNSVCLREIDICLLEVVAAFVQAVCDPIRPFVAAGAFAELVATEED